MQNILINFAQAGTYRRHFGSPNSLRNVFLCLFQLLANELTCEVNIDIFFKNNGYDGKTKAGNTARFQKIWNIGNALLYRKCYQLFDFLTR